MNIVANRPTGKLALATGAAAFDNPVLLIAADTASFCLLEELRSDGMKARTCGELATGSSVMAVFSPGHRAIAVVVGCDRGIVSLKFRLPVDVDAVLDGAALLPDVDRTLRLPPIRVNQQVEILRHGESLLVDLQDMSARAARLATTELCPGDEIALCRGDQPLWKATVKWTQGGVAGIAFSSAIRFADMADWIVEQQFGTPTTRAAHDYWQPAGRPLLSAVRRLLVVDPDLRRRAAVCHALGNMPLHVEPFADLSELGEFGIDGGLALVHDDGKAIPTIEQWGQTTDNWLPAVAYAEGCKPGLIVEAVKRGALDYLTWPFTPAQVTAMVTRIAPEIEKKSASARRRRHAVALINRLSDRERQILKAIISGQANRQIADITGLSVRTVESHRANILRKLGADHSSEAIRLGLEAGLD